MRNGRVALGVFLGAAACGLDASAQVSADGMVRGRQARQTEIGATLSVEHDTNVARTSASSAARQGIEPEDTIVAPSLDVNIVQPFGQQALFLRGSASYLFHDVNDRLDHSRFDVAGGLGASLGPCGSVLTGAYTRGRSQIEDRTLVRQIDNILSVKRVSVDLTCVRQPGLAVVVSAGKDWGKNSISSTSDYETESATAGLQYSRAATGTIVATASYARSEYPNRPSLTGEVEGFETVGLGLELRRQLGGRIQAVASASYTWVDLLAPPVVIPPATNGQLSEYEGLTYSVNLSYRVSSRLRAQASFDRRITPALLVGNTYDLQTSYDVRADYRVGSRFLFGLAGSQSENDVRGASMIGAVPPVESRTRAVVATLRYRQSEKLSFVLNAQYERRESSDPDLDYSGERVGLTTAYRF